MTLHGHSTDSAVQQPETPPGARSLDELRVVITRIWQDVLRLEDLTAEDNFFELGGHSLTASQVISRMSQALQVEVPLAAFFDHPTVAELAAFTAAAQQAGAQTGVQ